MDSLILRVGCFIHKTSILNIRKIFNHTAICAREHFNRFLEKIVQYVSRIFPNTPPDIEATKKEIWTDLSVLYYKYDYDFQKRAFREVLVEMSDKISEGKWATIYKRIYRNNNKVMSFTRTL
jgi:hypothetical protein